MAGRPVGWSIPRPPRPARVEQVLLILARVGSDLGTPRRPSIRVAGVYRGDDGCVRFAGLHDPSGSRAASRRPSRRRPVTAHPLLRLQGRAGNAAVQRLLAVQRAPKLRTAQDSRLRVAPTGALGEYAVTLEAGGVGHPVATMAITACTEADQLPVHIEDFVDTATNRAWVVFTYVPTLARVSLPTATFTAGALSVQVQVRRAAASDLAVSSAVLRGHSRSAPGETVRGHLGASEVDSILAAVVSAEGGFGTTQTYDRAVLTWGQGQWTAHSGTLQKALRFIIDRRPDLWTRYFAAHLLDVENAASPRFVHDGTPVPTTVPALARVFRPNPATSRRWVSTFSQFGLDPQVQRLQREYLRGEVRRDLAKTHAGNSPGDWLTTRGKALFFSMRVNLPAVAFSTFTQSVATAGGGHTGTPVPAAIKNAVSTELENRFRNSGVRAHQSRRGTGVADGAAVTIPRHHTIGFWGETGRANAVADCTTAIGGFVGGMRTVQVGGAAVRDPWTLQQWQNHQARMQARQSRYQKTAGDVGAALTRTDVEPDVPEEVLNPPPWEETPTQSTP